MPTFTQDIVIPASAAKCYQVLTDYQNYPMVFPSIHSVRVIRREPGFCLVSFELDIIMRVKYTLRIIEDPNQGLHWTLEDSNVLTLDNGSWTIKETAEGSLVTYELEVKLKGILPNDTTAAIARRALPETLSQLCTAVTKLDNNC